MTPTLTNRRPMLARILPGDIVLTEADIKELGLEQAPDDIGPSAEELTATTDRAGGQNHG